MDTKDLKDKLDEGVKEKTMANRNFWLGILVMTLIFGMTVISCDNGSTGDGGGGQGNTSLIGRWLGDDPNWPSDAGHLLEFFSNGTVRYESSGGSTYNGTYTHSGNKVTTTIVIIYAEYELRGNKLVVTGGDSTRDKYIGYTYTKIP